MGVGYTKNEWDLRVGETFQFAIMIFNVFDYKYIEFEG